MKKLYFTFILFLNFSVLSQGLNDVCASSALNVYAVGNSGLFYKSTNGGSSYSVTSLGIYNLNTVYSIGLNIWCAGANGYLYKSSNSGVQWSNQIIGGGIQLNSIYFIDSLTGYVTGNNGMIMKSNDGGISWAAMNAGVSYNLNEIKFTDTQTGYLIGDNPAILKTTNGGLNWVIIATPSLSSLRCIEVTANEIIAGSSENNLYVSTNAGINWVIKPLKILSIPGINALSIQSPGNYVIILESGTIWTTSDGGNNFSYSNTDFTGELNSIFVLGQRIFAVSKKQTIILRSNNNGATWTLPLNTTSVISFVQILGSSAVNFNKTLAMNYQRRGVLYSLEKETIYRTLNYGENWSILSSIPVDTSNYKGTQLMISGKDSSKILAGLNISSNGGLCRIYRTSNYGVSWVNVINLNFDLIGSYMAQDPQHPDTVYIGAKDSVFRSTDFGASWLKICEAPFLDWCDIAVKYDNSQVIYASTNHFPAKLNKSTNGGLNWFFVDFIADTLYSEMPTIALSNLNNDLLIHAQLGPTISTTGLKRSFTGGNTWLFTQLPGTSWAVDIAKDDPRLYAYGGVSYDPIFLSTNSGGNFTGTSNFYAEQLLYYDRSNLFINNHGIISKMKIVYNMPVIGIEPVSNEIPEKFSLEQNYPNPFNPVTNIVFEIPKSSFVNLKVYDALGREIETLVSQQMQAGKYNADWNAENYPSGVYFYRLVTDNFSESNKMVLVK